MRNYPPKLLPILAMVLLASCGTRKSKQEETVVPEGTPVTVISVTSGKLEETIDLNATSAFLLKTPVKSSVNGYIQKANATLGGQVRQGQTLFVIMTREAQSLGNSINSLDTSFHFSGIVNIYSPGAGFMSQLNNQPGDYVQDGEQLGTITDQSSFYFLMNIPFELKRYLPGNDILILQLPDSTRIQGVLQAPMPAVDSASQTLSYKIKVKTDQLIPEKLIAKVRLIKVSKPNAVSLPKTAVLTNETQQDFWVMKLVNDSTAVKVPVEKGIETHDRIEILSPPFTPEDKILFSGNYGLPDTAKVRVMQAR